jgi:hypothetical protein
MKFHLFERTSHHDDPFFIFYDFTQILTPSHKKCNSSFLNRLVVMREDSSTKPHEVSFDMHIKFDYLIRYSLRSEKPDV